MGWIDTFQTQKEQFILVQEGSKGLETFMHDELVHLNIAYRDQVIFFLKSCLSELEKKGADKDGKSIVKPK